MKNYTLILLNDGRNILVSDEKPSKNDYYIDYLVFPLLIQTPLQHSGVEYKEDYLNGVYKNPIIQSVEGTTSPKNNTNKVIAGYDTLPTLTYSDEVKQVLRDKYGWVDVEELMYKAIQEAKGNDFKTFYQLAAKNCTEVFKAHQSITNKMFSLEDVEKAIEMARETSPQVFNHPEYGYENDYTEGQIIQSLQQPIQLKVEIKEKQNSTLITKILN